MLPDAEARRAAVDPTGTSCSRRRPARARRACSSTATSTCCAPASIPGNILAITFTRKAAAEMRERIVRDAASAAAAQSRRSTRARWRELRDRSTTIAISTIDAFCLSLLREFPLEADLDPGFDDGRRNRGAAPGRRVARPSAAHLPGAWRASDADVALLFAQLGELRLRAGLAALLDRRLVAGADARARRAARARAS